MSSHEQILSYDFKQVNSTIVADISGEGHAGVIRNFDKGGATTSSATVFGQNFNILQLPGGEEGGYLELPSGILKNASACTVSMFVKCRECQERRTLFSMGADKIFSVVFEPLSDAGFNCHVMATSGGLSQAVISDGIELSFDEWYYISASFDTSKMDNRLSLYVNGIPKTSLTQKKVICTDLGDSGDNYIGFGPYSRASLSGDITNISILPMVLSEKETSLLFKVSDMERISFDVRELGFLSDITLENDISLPAKGTYGTLFSWSSSDTSLISKDGKITRPASGSEKGNATLTLNASYENSSLVYKFNVFVMPMPSASEILEKELSTIGIDVNNPIVSDLVLPSVLPSGAKIAWLSSNPDIIDVSGKVTRPSKSDDDASAFKEVILTAVASYEDAEKRREFSLKVPALKPDIRVIKVENITIDVASGTLPLLPSKVRVHLSNGRIINALVQWPDVSEYASFNDADTSITITGKLINYDGKADATLHFVGPGAFLQHIRPKGSHVKINNIQLGSGNIFSANKDRCLDYLKLLDCDRMLYNFRVTFGEDTRNALPLGGWDEPTGLLRGHSTGHFLSALALSFATTKDDQIKQKLDYMVSELRKLQKLSRGEARDFHTVCTPTSASQSLWSKDPSCWGEGYLGAYPPDQFALLEQYTPYATIWAPYYTLHKILAGLIDCYTYAENKTALETALMLGKWVENRLSATTKSQRDKMWSMYIAGEYGGMNESLATLSIITGEKSFLETAKMFDNPKLFEGLSVNIDTVSGIHANQHIPQIIGALEEFKASNDQKYYRIAKAFWEIVTNHYSYSIGGVGRGEIFKEPDILAGNIDTDRNCETCAMYNMLKLTKRLYEYEPENFAYMDYYEKGLMNQIAASQNPKVGKNMHNGVTYMLPIGPGTEKEYSSDYDDFTCCHGTGMENHVKYQDSIYYISDEKKRIYINLYISSALYSPSLLTMKIDDCKQKAEIIVSADSDYKLRFRVPSWANNGVILEKNGKKICETNCPGGYIESDDSCRRGDIYTIYFPYSLRLELTPDLLDGSEVASICYGPYVMTCLSDKQDWIELGCLSDLNECFEVSWDKENSYPVLSYFGLRFIPIYAAHNTRYHTYFKIKRI